MARRKRATKRRRSTARRRNPIRRHRVSRRRAVARRRYRRNPVRFGGFLNQTRDLATSSVAALAGAAVGRTVSNLIPFGGSPVVNFAKGAAVAIAIRTFGERLIGREAARFAAVGAMLAPVKDLIVSFVPQAETFLGRSDQVMYLPAFPPAYAPSLRAYAGEAVGSDVIAEDTGSSGYGMSGIPAGYGMGAYTDY